MVERAGSGGRSVVRSRGEASTRGVPRKRRAPRGTSAERRAAQLLHLEAVDEATRRRIRRDWWVVLALLPFGFGIGALLVAVGIIGGMQVAWDPFGVVDAGRVGGPLWLHLTLSIAAASVFLVGTTIGLVGHLERRPPSTREWAERHAAAARDVRS